MDDCHNIAEIHTVRPQEHAVFIPQMVSIEKRADKRFPWIAEEFKEILAKPGCHAIVAKIDDKVVGHVVYEVHPKYFEILKLSADPNFNREGVTERLIEKMMSKLNQEERTQIVFPVNEHDLDTQVLLRDTFGFKADKIDKGHFENGDNAYTMRHRMLPVPELLHQMHAKLVDLTGMEWQVVRPVKNVQEDIKNEDKKYDVITIADHLKNPEGIAFRTSGKVRDPKAAYTAIMQYFDVKPNEGFINGLHNAKKVTIPASWVEQKHLNKGKLDELKEAFVPSDFQSRYHKDPGEDNETRLGR